MKEQIPVSDGFRDVMLRARAEANAWQHDYIGTEHMLFALLNNDSPSVATMRGRAGIDDAKVRDMLESAIRRGKTAVADGEVPYTTRAKKALEHAFVEARAEPAEPLPKHLLLGLLNDPHSIASVVLRVSGVTLESARAALMKDAV